MDIKYQIKYNFMRYNREKIKEEIDIYGQHYPCPKSKTVVETHDGKQYWRHYEFGAIYGFVYLMNMLHIGMKSQKKCIESCLLIKMMKIGVFHLTV